MKPVDLNRNCFCEGNNVYVFWDCNGVNNRMLLWKHINIYFKLNKEIYSIKIIIKANSISL